ncbi:AI-2E family transporter [Pedobacter frigiditerrae]|uniref:AI-2E family transporter n=1 Tax=Pedobacter frigiditerrae TaxID=2530452 RepID=A0A4R0MRU7_9SPHI|nr:AI-2E family transporter [Pedobacter frigiditerrae]TCC89453.1 AI-2E family transporter [Pedobacter frigiditerrae]
MKEISLPFVAKLALVLLSIIMLGYLAILGKSLLAPLLFSLLMAFLLLPFANFLERKLSFGRSIATITAVILMIAVLYGILYFLGNQIGELWADWPLLVKQVTKAFDDIRHWAVATFHLNLDKMKSPLTMDNAEKALATSATIIGTTLITLSSSLLFLAFTLLFTFFILNYRRLLFTFLTTVFAEEHKTKVVEIVSQIQSIIRKYVSGLFLQMLIVSTLMIVTLSLFGVKYAILLGLIAGIFNIIPYLGISTALLISALITFATAGAAKALLVILVFVGVHTIDGNILMPLVVGSKVKINALFAFIGIIVGEMIWGISGMFLCIPYLAMLKIIFERVDGLQPWGALLGEGHKTPRKRRTYRITKKIKLEDAE